MVNTYKLVNPYIRGEFETKVKTKNSVEAARSFYNGLSEHFNNSVPKFYFTIQKGGSSKGKFFHFEVEESRKGDDVNFSIRPLELDNLEKTNELFISNFKNFKGRFNARRGSRKGSRKSSRRGSRKSSRKGSRKVSRKSSRKASKKASEKTSEKTSRKVSRSEISDRFEDDFEEDDFYRNALEYVPVASQPISYLYYDPLIYNLDSVFLPTFYAYLSPYVELNTSGLTLTQTYIN
jgi:hypothetical protein